MKIKTPKPSNRTQKSVMYMALVLVLVVLCFAGWSSRSSSSHATTVRPPTVISYPESKTESSSQSMSQPEVSSSPPTSNSPVSPVTLRTAGEPKPKEAHASKILASGDFPQLQYYALGSANDPGYVDSWYHSKIQSGRAWDASTGSSGTVIAVIDTGFALAHEDLTSKWAQNTGELGSTTVGSRCWTGTSQSKSTNNCDDDNNGYVDDWRGWDFVASDNNPQTGTQVPAGNGTQHGTMVSSIIAASSNNAKGIAGIDWQAKIMPLQVLDDDGSGYTYDIVAAIEYATNNGAKIINMSLGGSGFDQALLDAVDYAKSQGILVVAASGNCGASISNECAGLTAPGNMTYPAKYANVLSVGATTSSDLRSSFSSYGTELDIVAPGSSVGPLASWSTEFTTNGYVTSSNGTSFAAPIVAGVAGLIRAQLSNPSVDLLTNILQDSADKVGDLTSQIRSNQYGYGRVNAHKATLLAASIASPPGTVGTAEIQSRQPPRGGLTRSSTGVVGADEWILITCRVETSDTCASTVASGATINRITPYSTEKGQSVSNMFVRGSTLSSGAWTVLVHNRSFAYKIADIIR